MDAIKEVVRGLWDSAAAEFDQRSSHGLLSEDQARAWRALICEVAGETPLDALDVGCGTGFLSLLLAEQGHRVTGVDLARAMLTRARAKAAAAGLEVKFIEADIEHLDLAPASIDLVIERHVLWTLPHPELALDSWRRLLRPEGRLVLIEGHWGAIAGEHDAYAQIRDRLPLYGGRPAADIVAMVSARGFDSVEARPLMRSDLWIEHPRDARYMIIAR